ncbi:MAG TPA: enoyl-CoA hydratase-related protein [Burkholderiales bacterium]
MATERAHHQETICWEVRDEIGWIRLNRPQALNALTPAMLARLETILDRARLDAAVRAVVITGAGAEAFSAGADIRVLNQATVFEVREFARLAVSVTSRIESLGKVVVAAINGHAVGGGLELAEACALRVAAPHARLGHPEVRIGAVAGFGGTTRLPRLIGKGRAAELLLTGRLIDAEEALRFGLVNRIAPAERLVAETESLVREILMQAPLAVKLSWEALHRGLDVGIEQSAMLGADYFGLVAASDDFRAGTAAFIEKRRAVYTGS